MDNTEMFVEDRIDYRRVERIFWRFRNTFARRGAATRRALQKLRHAVYGREL